MPLDFKSESLHKRSVESRYFVAVPAVEIKMI